MTDYTREVDGGYSFINAAGPEAGIGYIEAGTLVGYPPQAVSQPALILGDEDQGTALVVTGTPEELRHWVTQVWLTLAEHIDLGEPS